MKHQVPDSMKFKKLQRRLGVSRVVAAGTLELLWISAQKNAPRGDIGRFTNEEIAIECDWGGDPDLLVAALVESGWLDECQENRLVVHDWSNISRDYREPAGRRRDLGTSAWKQIRQAIIEAANSICHYCGGDCSNDPTVDHVIPVVLGGTQEPDNLVCACRKCNGRKGGRDSYDPHS